MAQEVGDSSLVGYSVRFASTYEPGVTKIRYVTDGWLLRETTLLDPLLRHCSVLIIDEAHERSLNTELLLGVVKKIRRARPELRVVVCSATLGLFCRQDVQQTNRIANTRHIPDSR